ncbi:MAG: BrnA antitoxin family protein [Burkholderiaceae bacterium]|nr:BrnA antitoxin family protein [Burkholderiaceae bacterium]
MRKEYDFSKGKRGAVVASPGKTRITIMLDDDVIEHFREMAEAQGRGYQTMINSALREAIKETSGESPDNRPVTVGVLRDVLREELNPSRAKRSSTNPSPKRTAAGKPSSAA